MIREFIRYYAVKVILAMATLSLIYILFSIILAVIFTPKPWII
jgi:hypothetical protein